MRRALSLAFLAFLLTGCGALKDQVPIADAGPDQAVDVGTVVQLDGSDSFVPASSTISYQWTITTVPVGSAATLTNATSVNPTFTPDLPGTYTFTLVVSDGTTDSDPDKVSVVAAAVDFAPSADAGLDQLGVIGTPVTVDGTGSSDPESAPITYQWTIVSAPTGSTATLSSATAAQPTLTPDVDGTWALTLVVNDGNSDSTTDFVVVTTVWDLNQTNAIAAIFTTAGGSPLPVNVQTIDAVDVSGTLFVHVLATGIPDYQHTLTAGDINFLNTVQPDTKFTNNSGTTLLAGAVVDLGTNVGYKVIDACFTTVHGGGWFPPGPTCPGDQGHDVYFPLAPQPAAQTCYTQVNTIGMYRNGVAMFNWSDAQTYLDEGTWHQLAAKFEVKDLDLCASHANQSGNYHHHLNPNCLAEQLGDAGTAHSPIYGYAADGYPIYGLWHANGVKAQSCWKLRDYDTPSPLTGCGTSKKRTCVMVDNLDPNQGTVAAANPGPDTDAVEISEGGDPYTVASGYYFEDYFFDSTCAAAGGEFLDQNNGHDHDALGYHYHQTESFPYNVGPAFHGELFPNGILSCSAVPAAKPTTPSAKRAKHN